ncbi:Ig-like domain-containing protein [Salegentibacter chungangensis]|uniref:Ig-like domain-containing protein n=1 Tax=Salegentibacter chungangensis TaxID=1335724 RepID=A0ABW3NLD7_9FLAO
MKKLVYLAISVLILGCSTEEDPTPQPNPTPENPVAVDDALSAKENEELVIDADVLLDNDTTTDNARISSFEASTSEGGELKDNRDGTYTYNPPADFQGEDTFSYTICVPGDSDRCSTATVTVNVGDAGDPQANADTYETAENTSLSIKNHLSNDVVVDNASVIKVEYEGTNGTAVLENDGSITYTPNETFSGEDSFTYTLCDDDENPSCSTATITVNVIDEGSPVANDDAVVISVGTDQVVIDDVLNNDEAIDGAVIASVNADGNGTAELNADGTITYKPASGFEGKDSFTYSLCDDDATSTCVTGTVTVTIVDPVAFDIPSGYEDYYGDVTFTEDPQLLLQVLTDFTTDEHVNRLEYYQRHDYLYEADEDLNNSNNVILMYSGDSRPKDEYQQGDLSEGETFNTEHIYPQSRLSSEEAKNDMHHMRVADVDINSQRLNFPFTDGSGSYKLVDGDKWYPGDEWKGDVARMVMYVHLRYGEDFETVGSLQLFLEWNREDPVSDFEIQRNNVIEGAQGNRNPFIDNPYLATLIWGGEAAENRW